MGRPEGQHSSGRVVSAQRVRDSGQRVRVPVPGHEACAEPVIEVVRQGDVVVAIDITCPCGRSFRVVCDYGGTAEA
jgi:hypothetical protein